MSDNKNGNKKAIKETVGYPAVSKNDMFTFLWQTNENGI